jgi:hypothetical protein
MFNRKKKTEEEPPDYRAWPVDELLNIVPQCTHCYVPTPSVTARVSEDGKTVTGYCRVHAGM